MKNDDDKKPYDPPLNKVKWITKQMYQQGYLEYRNGVIFHRSYAGRVIRRDKDGNYLITLPD